MKRRFSKRQFGALVIGLTLMSWAHAQVRSAGDELPSAASILDRYIEVTGGAAAYEARTSDISRGAMTIAAAGITGQLVIHTRPGMQHTRMELPNIGVIESKDHFSRLETTGIEDVGGEPAYRVVLTRDEMSITELFSVESGRLLKTAMSLDTPLGTIPVEQIVDDYTDFGGILIPSRLSISQAGNLIVITVNSVEANVDIPDEQFALPADIAALIE